MENELIYYDIAEKLVNSNQKRGNFLYTQHPIFHESGDISQLRESSYLKIPSRNISSGHDNDKIFAIFSKYLVVERLPILSKGRIFNKEGAVSFVEDNINSFQTEGINLSFNDYMKRELLKFFLEAYKSEKTKFLLDDQNTEGLLVDLRETLNELGFNPRRLQNGHWITITDEMYDLLKRVLIHRCKIDSVEVAQIRYGVRDDGKFQKIITTACNNPFERFYRYYLNGYKIDVVPQLKLVDGKYEYVDPILRYSGKEQYYRDMIIRRIGINPELNVIRPPSKKDLNDLSKE